MTTISEQRRKARVWRMCDSRMAEDCDRMILPGSHYWRLYGRAHRGDPAFVVHCCEACRAWHKEKNGA